MKKILFLLLNMIIISSTSYSEIRNINGIILDDKIFGETEICQAIGGYYFLNTLGFTEMEMYGQNSDELFNDVVEGMELIDTLLKSIGWNVSPVEIENIKFLLYVKLQQNKNR